MSRNFKQNKSSAHQRERLVHTRTNLQVWTLSLAVTIAKSAISNCSLNTKLSQRTLIAELYSLFSDGNVFNEGLSTEKTVLNCETLKVQLILFDWKWCLFWRGNYPKIHTWAKKDTTINLLTKEREIIFFRLKNPFFESNWGGWRALKPTIFSNTRAYRQVAYLWFRLSCNLHSLSVKLNGWSRLLNCPNTVSFAVLLPYPKPFVSSLVDDTSLICYSSLISITNALGSLLDHLCWIIFSIDTWVFLLILQIKSVVVYLVLLLSSLVAIAL